jgi:hypothetical protein
VRDSRFVFASLLWNKCERVEIVGGDLPHPGTPGSSNVERDQLRSVRSV